MSVRQYFPSGQFSTIVGSLLLSALLIYGAIAYTHPPQAPAQVGVASADTSNANWQATLDAIEAQDGSTTAAAPGTQDVNTLLAAAQTPNVTESVAKSILINLANAKSQGLGDDIPTQNQIVSQAATQIANSQSTSTVYSLNDLTVIAVSNTALHTYGNAVMQALAAYPAASEQATFLSIDEAVEGGDKTQAATLAQIGAAYKGAALALLAVPVPQTLAPLHLQFINDLLAISATYTDMETISSDPLRGLVGLQNYESLMDEGARVFTNIAQELNNDGILFTKDEPGSAWSVFSSSP